mmetsp:Transcript_25551/g.55195  ORF Transcript_25551/g.55195 Transcript_25551/m.55195 type:complete len:83 (+) Transcript_25551:178-426(+)
MGAEVAAEEEETTTMAAAEAEEAAIIPTVEVEAEEITLPKTHRHRTMVLQCHSPPRPFLTDISPLSFPGRRLWSNNWIEDVL